MATCKQRISSSRGWGDRPCGRPVKGEWGGEPMCGIHLAGRRKRQANGEKWRAEWDAKMQAQVASSALADRLTDLGFKAAPSTDRTQPGVRLTADVAELLISRLEES